jgi:hypothetical protein
MGRVGKSAIFLVEVMGVVGVVEVVGLKDTLWDTIDNVYAHWMPTVVHGGPRLPRLPRLPPLKLHFCRCIHRIVY